MKPVLFTIQGVNVEALPVFFALGFFVFVLFAWFNLHKYIKPNKIFDTAVFSIFLAAFIGRIVFFIQNIHAFSTNGWYVFPFRDTQFGVGYFNTLPWNFFAIWDKGVYYNFIPFALGFSAFIYLKKVKAGDFIHKVLPLVWYSFIPAYVFVLIGFLLDGNYVGLAIDFPLQITYEGLNQPRIAVQLIELLALAICLVFYLDSQGSRKFSSAINQARFIIFPLFWTITQVGIWFLTDNHEEKVFFFDEVQISWVLLFIVYLVAYVSAVNKNRGKAQQQTTPGRKMKRVYLSELGSSNTLITAQQRSANNSNYSYSFSRFGKKVNPQLSTKEKLTQIKNKLTRNKL